MEYSRVNENRPYANLNSLPVAVFTLITLSIVFV